MKRIVIAALTLPVFLVGCADEGTQSPTDNATKLPLIIEGELVRDGDADIPVRKFEIGGTTCIASGYDGAGLSCDWSN